MHVTQPIEAGVPAVVAAIAVDQAARGHDVTIVCPGAGLRSGPLTAALAPAAIETDATAAAGETSGRTSITGVAWEAGRSPGPSVPAEALRLGRIIRRHRPEVVFLHSAKAGLAGRLALRGRIPTVFVPHAWSFEAVTGPLAALSSRWERLARRWCAAVVCVSADERDRGLAAGIAGPMTVIDNGVDLVRFAPRERGSARADLGLGGQPTAVCVGRLARQKGQDRLVEVWDRVRARVPDAQLVLVGDGPDAESLHQASGPGVLLVGAVTDPRPYLAAADVVALASRWEAGGLVVLEAMAAARSVVAVDVTGLRGVLEGTGRVVAPDDASALIDALVERLSDPVATDADGLAARSVAQTRHGLEHSLAQWEQLTQQVTGSTGHPQPAGRADR